MGLSEYDRLPVVERLLWELDRFEEHVNDPETYPWPPLLVRDGPDYGGGTHHVVRHGLDTQVSGFEP